MDDAWHQPVLNMMYEAETAQTEHDLVTVVRLHTPLRVRCGSRRKTIIFPSARARLRSSTSCSSWSRMKLRPLSTPTESARRLWTHASDDCVAPVLQLILPLLAKKHKPEEPPLLEEEEPPREEQPPPPIFSTSCEPTVRFPLRLPTTTIRSLSPLSNATGSCATLLSTLRSPLASLWTLSPPPTLPARLLTSLRGGTPTPVPAVVDVEWLLKLTNQKVHAIKGRTQKHRLKTRGAQCTVTVQWIVGQSGIAFQMCGSKR